MGGVVKSIGGITGGIVDPAISGVLGSMKLGGMVNQLAANALSQAVSQQSTEDAFKALLMTTIEHVNQKPTFNLELEINDLLVRLGALRVPTLPAVAPGAATAQALTGSVEQMLQNLTSISTRRQDMMKSIIGNLR